MARRKNRSSGTSTPSVSHRPLSQVRDTLDVANPFTGLDLPEPTRLPKPLNFRDPVARLLTVEDRRTWHPEGHYRPAVSARRWNVPVVFGPSHTPRRAVYSPARGRHAPARRVTPPLRSFRFRFKAARFVMVCVRRKLRREVLFAFKKAGRRGVSRRRRWNYQSSVYC